MLAVTAIGADVADARGRGLRGRHLDLASPALQWRRDIAAEPLGVVEGARASPAWPTTAFDRPGMTGSAPGVASRPAVHGA